MFIKLDGSCKQKRTAFIFPLVWVLLSRGSFFPLFSPFFSQFFPTTCNNYNQALVFSGFPTWMSMSFRYLGVRLPSSALSVRNAFYAASCSTTNTILVLFSFTPTIPSHATGPKTNSVEMITQLRNAGLNVVRMNFSHGTHEASGQCHPLL